MNYRIQAIILAFGFMVFNVSYAGQMASKQVMFTFPDFAQAKYPKLIPLIINSDTLTDIEKQGFLNSLPKMTKEQIERLDKILSTKNAKLLELKPEIQQVWRK